MNARVLTTCAVILALVAPATATAWPFFDVTASEVVSTDPPRYRTTFTITESGPTPPGGCGWGFFFMRAMDPGAVDAPEFFDCAASSSWTCQSFPVGDETWMLYEHNGTGEDTYPAYTFSVVTDQAEPCVRVEYHCWVLMGSPPPPFDACLSVDMPVPAAPTSWGAVKSIYR